VEKQNGGGGGTDLSPTETMRVLAEAYEPGTQRIVREITRNVTQPIPSEALSIQDVSHG
jgi:hypothetical protein